MSEHGLFGELPPPEHKRKLTKSAFMWHYYGKRDDKRCSDCLHLITVYGDMPRTYFKCELYGVSASSATDWRKKWTACGKFQDRG